jgi:hypothetical protein
MSAIITALVQIAPKAARMILKSLDWFMRGGIAQNTLLIHGL